MKEKFIKIFAIISCIFPLAAIGNAQTVPAFEVPFEFTVRDKVLPAGEYILQSPNYQKTFWVVLGKTVKTPVVSFWSSPMERLNKISQPKLTFRQYGDRHFLAEFTITNERIILPKTKEEKLLQR